MKAVAEQIVDIDKVEIYGRVVSVRGLMVEVEELIRLGAYRAGSSAEVDEAIALHKPLEAFLGQLKEESTTMAEGYQCLERILRGEETQN